ncbi:aldehyde dehydrogenase-like protein [Lophium mytilinum]|uniref:aldehyde dehydrogenase (NAD(+)) n=1 Tax=Lophium mytilinum TaxID=390894 RepID=A0A6A6R7V7_9PEZI|nr:aldehyde dehydrogenase-like protein [Lophium mytilinum]
MDQLQGFELYGAGIVSISAVLLVLYFLRTDLEAPVPYHVSPPKECSPQWKGEILDNPSLKIPNSSAIQCYCPATGASLGQILPSTPTDIDRAIAQANEAQIQWSKTTFSQRRRVLKTMLKFVLENQDTIAHVACLDSGKTRIDASFGEILITAEKLKWMIDHGETALKPERRPTNFLMMYKVNEVTWEPLGVVAACVSWNYPFHNLIGPIISSIFAGNGIIVKGSEATAWSSTYFAEIAKAALHACGHSPALVQSISCWPSVADHLTSHPGISHLTFIGSRPVAHAVCASAAKSLTPLCVELGGKDAAIVLDDVPGSDFRRVASILLRGVFQSAGQNCIGIERVVALPRVYAKLVDHLTPLIRALRSGSALDAGLDTLVDVGASISEASFSRLEELIQDAVASGARLLAGGSRYTHPEYPRGHYFTPTLLVDVTPEMRIARTELFAPVCLLMRASSVTNAIAIANGTEYGLGASVFGKSTKDLDRVAREVQAGMVSVNDFGVYYAVQLPFGGVKGSGYGRFAGEEGLRSVCSTKAICRDRWPSLVKTAIPPPLELPFNGAEKKAWEMASGVVKLGYGDLRMKVEGLRGIIGI